MAALPELRGGVLRLALRALRRLAAAAALLVLAAALLLLALLLEPQWFLTSRSVGWAIRTFGAAYRPGWTSFDFSIRSRDALEKEVAVSASEFCFEKTDRSLAGCFKTIDARFAFALSPAGVRLVDVSRFVVDGETLRVDETQRGAAAPRSSAARAFSLPRLIPAAAGGARFGKARVELPSFELVDSSGTTIGSLSAEFEPARAAPLSLDARWRRRPRRGRVRSGRARLDVASDLFRSGRLTYADASGSARSDGVSVDFSARARQAGAQAVAVEAKASGRAAGAGFRLSASGVATPVRLTLKGGFRADTSTGPVRGLSLAPFTASLEREAAAGRARLRADAALRAELAPLPEYRGFKAPAAITGRARLDAAVAGGDRLDASLSVQLNPYETWYEAHADLFARATGRLSDLPRARIRQRVDAFAAVPRFEDLVAYLAGGPFAVPAPVADMKGAVSAALTARGEPGSDRIDVEYRARAALAGVRQKLNLHAAGSAALSGLRGRKRAVAARAALTFDDAALQLPHLSALKMPRVTLDPRIKSPGAAAAPPPAEPEEAYSAAPAASSTTVDLELTVATARPIVLYTDLAQTPVPLALALKLAKPAGTASGDVSLQAFDVEFFRRRAHVDHLTLTLAPGSKKTGLDGLIKYKAPEALISIRLLGTTDKPRVVFESDPPLGENDIIAMLVFGKSPNELDADQSATVANAQTAMSDKAFGLASLYLFASTPIQFVGYDPAAKAYTMKLSIPGGETLSLSSDFDATKTVQLRKRLTRHLAIATEAVNSQTRGSGVVTFLEWFTRY